MHNIISKIILNLYWGIVMNGQLAKIGLVASMLSVVGSLYLYFVSEDQMLGIFVGLWAPTLILATKGIEEWMENKS
tara:strand:+ start:1744 stop:1971 length:228 start_codon:yes stop_codon:yes gene_type:complete